MSCIPKRLLEFYSIIIFTSSPITEISFPLAAECKAISIYLTLFEKKNFHEKKSIFFFDQLSGDFSGRDI